jgi:hypothetical protein
VWKTAFGSYGAIIGCGLAFAPSTIGAGSEFTLEELAQQVIQRNPGLRRATEAETQALSKLRQPRPTTDKDHQDLARIKIELQSSDKNDAYKGQTKDRKGNECVELAVAPLHPGVLVDQAIVALSDVSTCGQSYFDKEKDCIQEFEAAVGRARVKLENYPPGGVMQHGSHKLATFSCCKDKHYRIDLNNYKGHNLRFYGLDPFAAYWSWLKR